MNNFTKIGMPLLVVLFLLVAAISITMTVTRENTLRQVAAAANTPVANLETQLAQASPAPGYAANAQPEGSSAILGATADGDALASCHTGGTQVTGTTTGYSAGVSGGGCCRGGAGQTVSATPGATTGGSCH